MAPSDAAGRLDAQRRLLGLLHVLPWAGTAANFFHNSNLKELRVSRAVVYGEEWSVEIMPDQTIVLVAEDEESVRLVIVQALLDEGFEVMEAEHAEAALIALKSHARCIHVLFTDIQMPGTMDGLALAHHTSKHWPRIGLLVTSAGPHPDRASFPKESRFVAKPYEHRHVVRHIRELAAAS